MVTDQWISFQVGAETYVHPIDNVKEIIPYDPPVPVPGAPSFTEGILNVRGNVITVLSGRMLFAQPKDLTPEDWRIVILERGSEQIGISVDTVGSIIHFEPDDAEWDTMDSQSELIKGTLQQGKDFYILTDFSNIGESQA